MSHDGGSQRACLLSGQEIAEALAVPRAVPLHGAELAAGDPAGPVDHKALGEREDLVGGSNQLLTTNPRLSVTTQRPPTCSSVRMADRLHEPASRGFSLF